MKYLLGQSDIFKHFIQNTDAPLASTPRKAKGKGGASSVASPSPARRQRRASVDDEDEDEEVKVVRLSRQPEEIKFGTMRDYQLEGLNWMLSLFENGTHASMSCVCVCCVCVVCVCVCCVCVWLTA